MNHLEIEYKTLLTKEEFLRLLNLFQTAPAVQQTNHYLDTTHFDIRDAKMSLRIRTFEDRAELTLKIPKKVGNMEYNMDLTLTEAMDILDGQPLPDGQIKDILESSAIDLSLIKNLGSLTTIRREITHSIGLMALDESHYFQQVDYELELEVEDAKKGEAAFQHFLKQQGIEYKFAKSKVARFAQNL